MRVYLETSVVVVWLFGAEREPERRPATEALFRLVDEGRVQAVISLYTLQEVYTFCEENFPRSFPYPPRRSSSKSSRLRVRSPFRAPFPASLSVFRIPLEGDAPRDNDVLVLR